MTEGSCTHTGHGNEHRFGLRDSCTVSPRYRCSVSLCSNMQCISRVNQDPGLLKRASKLNFSATMQLPAQITMVEINLTPPFSQGDRAFQNNAHIFVRLVFVNFSTSTVPIDTKIGRHCQWASTMLSK